MVNFKEEFGLFTENTEVDETTLEGIKKLKKSSAIVKNSAVIYDNTIYFEAKSTKQAIRLTNSKIADMIGHNDDNVIGLGGGAADGYYDKYKRDILGNPDAKAYVKIEFKRDTKIPDEYIKAAGAKKSKAE
jgi:serine protease inhibitor